MNRTLLILSLNLASILIFNNSALGQNKSNAGYCKSIELGF
jgi:hypothetical protein